MTDWQAKLRLGFTADCGSTRLLDRWHSGPLRVQKALYPKGKEVCQAIIVHPPGGVGGDALALPSGTGQTAKYQNKACKYSSMQTLAWNGCRKRRSFLMPPMCSYREGKLASHVGSA